MKFTPLKKLFSIITVSATIFAMVVSNSASAYILGSWTGHTEQEFAQGTTYVKNSFYSDQSGVGQQVENYFLYYPNTDVSPIVYNGTSIWGKRTLTQANSSLVSQGINSAMGMNADFFSFQTGVPMSHTIVDGKVLTKDSSWMPSIGFNADGTGFISELAINTFLTTDNGYFPVECINKYRQPYFVYLYTDDFADTTNAKGWGINVTLGSVNGEFKIGSEVTAVVEDISEGDGSVSIPSGKIVLSVDASASQELKDRLYSLSPGQSVQLSTSNPTSDARWNNVQYGIGCTGGTLLTNGQLNFTDESAAPRSAVGIKADGSILFYTLDGRQNGYSYGARKETLAQRLLELGCVDAVNLDGGGSTSMGGVYPETTDFQVLNSPSDGTLRSCANFIFLRKNNPYTGVPYKLMIHPYGETVLSGSTVQLWTSAIDSAYGKATITDPVEYYIEKDTPASGTEWYEKSAVENGLLTARGDGDVYVAANSGSANGTTMLHVVRTPTAISVANEDTQTEVGSIQIKRGESINLTASAYQNDMKITAQDYAFWWDVDSDGDEIGSIDSMGFFTASNKAGATGKIRVNAGDTTREIPVTVTDEQQPSNPANYPTISGNAGDSAFTATLGSIRSAVTKEMVTLKVDGKETDFQFDDATSTLTYTYPDGFKYSPHRIGVFVTDAMEYSAMSHFDIGDYGTVKNSFGDTSGHWAENYINYLSSLGIVKGSPDENNVMQFLPEKKMNRAELACMLCNYLGINVGDYTDIFLPFEDTSSIPFWAVNQVKALHSLGIMKGQLDGDKLNFNPYAEVKRLEYAIAAERLLPSGLRDAAINATDKDSIPWWAMESMEVITGQGIMNGYPDGSIRPNQSVTRAEAVKIMFSIL